MRLVVTGNNDRHTRHRAFDHGAGVTLLRASSRYQDYASPQRAAFRRCGTSKVSAFFGQNSTRFPAPIRLSPKLPRWRATNLLRALMLRPRESSEMKYKFDR